MSRASVCRPVATAASVVLVAAGLTVGMGAGVSAGAGTCNQTSSVVKSDIATGGAIGIHHTYTKTVTTAEAAAGTEVTYRTVISTSGIGNPYVNRVTDFAPAGFGAPVRAVVTVWQSIVGMKSNEVATSPDGAGYKVSNAGWFVNSGNPLTVEMTYLVPASASVGAQITSGGISVDGTAGVQKDYPDLTSCFTVRLRNAGETATGSLEGAGLGSSDGQLSSSGSLSDLLSDTISKTIANAS